MQRIIQSADSINFYYDIGQGSGFNRPVAITNRPHLPKEIRLYWGDNIAKWEGEFDEARWREATGDRRGVGRNPVVKPAN